MKRCYFAVLFLCLVATRISAQPQPAWGTSAETALVIGAYEFQGFDSGTTTGRATNTADRYITAGGNLVASVNLPKGALVTGLELQGCNSSTTSVVSYYLGRIPTGTSGDFFVGGDVPVSSGCGKWRTDFSHVVDATNGPYVVIWQSFDRGGLQFLTAMRVFYKLQVSIPPGTPTFGDVPATHLFYQYIEALAASGITAGCGGGNYCPDAPLTRGQMAVFLSKALGLHFTP